MTTPGSGNIPTSLEDNLKKALTELLILYLLAQREYYIGELADTLQEKSHGALSIVFPYSAIYRLLHGEYIKEYPKHIAPDGRRRQYYGITPTGRAYLNQLLTIYRTFTNGVAAVLEEGEEKNG